ncbi:cysteine dioxygenase [Burkholderia phage BcepNazgul]|uniref:Uncharacterized protein n=1 Tax=Burkholderia phage BcepNazgul TaxID=242861 RepID=Q6UYK6_9CAUD|nr:cysteine dioxygenase [Burkholderia phage BcepNazgul]AAQ63335.1 conserved hypothetical protein [Burkholderia phage BcepNazgul]
MRIANPQNRLWQALVSRLGQRLIDRAFSRPADPVTLPDLANYMHRRWLVKYSRWTLGRCARIHHILRSDSDRDFHDHPWPYVTIILDGGYTEVTPVYTKANLYKGEHRQYYGPGSILVRSAKHLHRLELEPGTTATTLFIAGRWEQEWGFITNPNFKMYWKDYLARETDVTPARAERRTFLMCACPACAKLTYLARYHTDDDKRRAGADLIELMEAGRNPFTKELEIGASGRTIFPEEYCACRAPDIEDGADTAFGDEADTEDRG